MANAGVIQGKTNRLVILPETTVGTQRSIADLVASGSVVPAESVAFSPDRGNRIISRAGVVDGRAGEMIGAVGTWGWSVGFSSEIHEVTETTTLPYWAKLALACGMSGSAFDSTGPTYFRLEPTTAHVSNYVDNYTGTGKNPCSLTMYHGIADNATNDRYEITNGAVGSFTLNMNAGERITCDYTFKGRQDSSTALLFDGSANPVLTVGSADAGVGIPLTVKNFTLVCTDLTDSATITLPDVQSIVIATNANVADVLDAQQANGFGVSPVLWDEAPTLTMTCAFNSDTDLTFMNRFKQGGTFSLVITAPGTNRKITIDCPIMQLVEVGTPKVNGWLGYELQFKLVRAFDGATYPFRITYEDV